SLQAQSVIDFGATYNITLPDGSSLGSMRRKGLRSSFVRDELMLFDRSGTQIATVRELGSFTPFARRYVEYASILFPQRYEVIRIHDGKKIAELRQHFNPFIFRLGVSILDEDDEIDDLLILGVSCLISAIEGRQG
ncbi:unnamed protein product, partial [Laminaria digitata]